MSVLTWKRMAPRHGPSFMRGFLGSVAVASVQYSLSARNAYTVTVTLPNIKDKVLSTPTDVSSEELGTELAERIVSDWLHQADLVKVAR